MMTYEAALRLWGATKLTEKFSGLSLEDMDINATNVSIEVDPGCPNGEDSFYEPAHAVVRITGSVTKDVEVTVAGQFRWRGDAYTTTLNWKNPPTTDIDYPDMFTIAREMNELT